MNLRVGVVGGGGFGRGIALASHRLGNEVTLWTRSDRKVEGTPYGSTSNYADLAACELIFVAVPSEHVPSVADGLCEYVDGRHMLVHVSRGLLGDELETLTSVMRKRTACRKVGALAGPLVAEELAKGAPGGAIVGSLFPEVSDAVRRAITGPAFKIYSTDDVIGVEVASAMVGLLALAAGYAQGLGVGPSALAVLCTRGIVEAKRVGLALGAREQTFVGLAGLGDLLAAASGDDRPELKLGRALAKGASLAEAGRAAGAHIEGVTIGRRVMSFAKRRSLDVPIASTVAAVLDGTLSAEEAVHALMTRQVLVE